MEININSLKLNNGINKYNITNSEETTFPIFKEKYESGTLVPGRTYIYSHISTSNSQAHFDGEIDSSYSSNVNVFSLNLEYKIAVTATSNNTIDENIKVLSVRSGRDYIFTRCSEWEVKYDLDVSRYDWADKLNSVTTVNSFDYLNNTYYLTDDEPITTEDNETCYTFKTTDNQLTMYGFYSTRENKFCICELERDSFYNTYYSIIRDNIQLMSRVSCGVITYLKDEYGNAMPFDFKCLLQVLQDESSYHAEPLDFMPWFSYSNRYIQKYNIYKDDAISIALELNGTSTNNIVNEFYDVETHKYSIPKIQFSGPCHNNVIGKKCDDICIGMSSSDAKITYGSSNNVIGDNCSTVYIHESTAHNSIDSECSGIIIYPMSERNDISKKCTNIRLDKNNNSNVIGTLCRDIDMQAGCSYNTFGMGCAELELSEYSSYNNIGTHCYQLKFINRISHITVENGTQNYTFGNNDVNYCMINKSTGRQIENNNSVVSQRIRISKNDFINTYDDGIFYHTIPLYVVVDDLMSQIIRPMMNAGYIPFEGDMFSIVSYDKIYTPAETGTVPMFSSIEYNIYHGAAFVNRGWNVKPGITRSSPSFLVVGLRKSMFAEQIFMEADGELLVNIEFEIVGAPIDMYKTFYEKHPIFVENRAFSNGEKKTTQKMILPIPNIDVFDIVSKSYSIDDFIEILGLKNKGISFNVYSSYHLDIYTGLNARILDTLYSDVPLDYLDISPAYSYIEGVEVSSNLRLFGDFMKIGYSSYVIEFWCNSQQSFENLRLTGLKLNYPVFSSNGIKNQTILESKHCGFPMNEFGLVFGGVSVPSIMLTEDIVTDAVNELRTERTYTPCEIPGERMGTRYIGNYEFVDLGLPSRTKWCDRNLGASSEEDIGEYFFFGCDKSVDELSDEYNANPNSHGAGSLHEFILNYVRPKQLKAFINMGIMTPDSMFIPNTVNVMGTVYDMSTKCLGKPFATPSTAVWVELNLHTSKRLFKKNGVFGILFISNINGNTIFIPFNDIMSMGATLEHNKVLNGVGCSLASTDITYDSSIFKTSPVINSVAIGTRPVSFGFPFDRDKGQGPSIIVASGLQEQRKQLLSMDTAFPIRPITFI